MARKKSSNLRIYLTCMFCLIILVGLLWHTKADPAADETEISSVGDSLQIVKSDNSEASRILEYEGFTVNFNPEMHQPNYVVWELTAAESTATDVSRKDYDFEQDFDVESCATLMDYKRSGFSRGHMFPAADAKWDAKAMHDCFLLTNMCPQKSELNTGAWKSLEEKSRKWAQRDGSIIIICGPVLTDRLTRTIGTTPVPVPERFFKVILAPKAKPVRAIGFIMNNGYVEGGMQAAAVSVDEVERTTGFDFFSALPDDIEEKIEAECNFPLWSRKK